MEGGGGVRKGRDLENNLESRASIGEGWKNTISKQAFWGRLWDGGEGERSKT